MKLQNLFSAVAVLFALSVAASAQESAFKAGQSVYVAAVKSSGQPLVGAIRYE
jgi:Flp pilus assembly secretin CpaC